MFDLKDFRENQMKMTQAELAKALKVDVSTLTEIEKQPGQIPLQILIELSKLTGLPLDELTQWKLPKFEPLKVNNTWTNADFTKKNILKYIFDYFQKNRQDFDEEINNNLKELNNEVQVIIRKPKVAVVGHSDVGKSQLINSLLGLDKMPTAWTPTTSIVVYIKHIKDCPTFIKDDVWIFRSEHNGILGWDVNKLYDTDYCKQWKLAGGDIELLKRFGTRQGDLNNGEAGAAVIFCDSDLLNNCDLIDSPGFKTGDSSRDNELALHAINNADVLIYMSIANGFMRGTDIECLNSSLQSFKTIENKKLNKFLPLSNLFIVASHADVVDHGNSYKLDTILTEGCNRLLKTMPNDYWSEKSSYSGYDYNKIILRGRFFAFTTKIECLTTPFKRDLTKLLETLPDNINIEAKQYIKNKIADQCSEVDKAIKEYEKILENRERYETLLKEIKAKEPKRANDNFNKRKEIKEQIDNMKIESQKSFLKEYNSIINIDAIISTIDSKNLTKKKEDIEVLTNYLNASLQLRYTSVLKQKSAKLNELISEYLASFNRTIDNLKDSIGISDLTISFDAKRAFISGLVGLSLYGGLTAWAASLGNLGAYILIAKGVGVLSAMGISIGGGTAGAAAAIAAIGGPVTLGIALAVLTAIGVYVVLSGTWKKSIAKKILEEYEKQNCLGQYSKLIEQYWNNTIAEFNKSADSLEDKWQGYVESIDDMVKSDNVFIIRDNIIKAKRYKDFLAHIPL